MTAPKRTPGSLHYRCGTYLTFRDALESEVTAREVGHGTKRHRPLQLLRIEAPGNFVTGLIEAWAEVGDILTFYNERVANEGFLRTAIEERSVRWLAAQLGYSPAPALSAQVPLSFQLSPTRRPAGERVRIPKGTIVQSIPANGGQPIGFETATDLDATVEANAIPAWCPAAVAATVLNPWDTQVRVSANARVRAGQSMLIVGAAGSAHDGVVWFTGPISAVDEDPANRCRIVRWEGGVIGPLAAIASVPVDVFVFQSTSELFGYRARPWTRTAAPARLALASRPGGVLASTDGGVVWSACNRTLPAGDWSAVAGIGDTIVVAGPAGAYRSADNGRTWSATPLRNRAVFALARTPGGDILAGGANGGFFRSVDGGATWDTVTANLVAEARFPFFKRRVEQMPAVNVRTLLVHRGGHGGAVSILAGTDVGAYRSDDGITWSASSDGFPGWNESAGAAQAAVFAFTIDPRHGHFYAATSQGVFESHDDGKRWRPIGPHTGQPSGWLRERLFHLWGNAAQPAAPAFAIAAIEERGAHGIVLLAGTAAGVQRSIDGGKNWTVTLPIETRALQAVVSAASSVVIAGTESGLYRSSDGGATWQPAAAIAFRFEVPSDLAHALAPGPVSPVWMAAFRRAGVRLSPDASIQTAANVPGATLVDSAQHRSYSIQPENGQLVVTLAVASPIRALTIADTQLLAAGPPGDAIENDWPGLGLDSGLLDLDGLAVNPPPDSWVVVSESPDPAAPPTAPDLVTAIRVQRSAAIMRDRFGQTRQITRIVGAAAPSSSDLTLFDPRRASVALHSRPVDLFQPALPVMTTVTGSVLELAADCSTWKAGRTIVIGGARPRVFVDAAVGGLFRFSAPATEPATPAIVSCGWADEDPHAIAASTDAIAVAGDRVRIVRGDPSTAAWVDAPPSPGRILALAWQAGVLWGGGPSGIWTLSQDAQQWTPGGLEGREIFGLAVDSTGVLIAATDDGVYAAGASSWSAAGLQGTPISAIAIGTNDLRVAASQHGGVFTAASGGIEWTVTGAQGSQLRVSALAAGASQVLAATHGGGLFRYDASTRRWTRIDAGLPIVTIAAVAIDSGGRPFVSVPGWGVAVQSGNTWSPATVSVANAFAVLAALPSGEVLGAARRRIAMLPVGSIGHVTWQRAPVGTMSAASAGDLDAAFVSDAVSKALTAAGLTLKAPAAVTAIERGRRWRLTDASGGAWYLRLGVATIEIFRDDDLTLVAPAAAGEAWSVQLTSGLTGQVFTGAGDLTIDFAAPGAPTMSEAAIVSAPPQMRLDPSGGPVSSVTLRSPLENVYDARTVVIAANTVNAVQGETVYQVLGSGSAAEPHQRFTLQRSPLAVVVGPDGLVPRIDVYTTPDAGVTLHPRSRIPIVKTDPAVEWTRVDSLLSARPNDAVYAVELNADGIPEICFGDGVHGARLPTGRENVTARYAVGAGVSGNVGVGELRIVRSGGIGAGRASNLVPATGGSLPEPSDRIRTRIPLSVQTLDRIVSMSDYANYARVFPGVERCHADMLETPDGRVLALSIAATGNTVPDAGLLADLRTAISAASATDAPFVVGAGRPAAFRLHLEVSLDGSVEGAQVTAALTAALIDRFGVAHADFRRPVFAADVITIAEATRGVLDASVTALFRVPGPILRSAVLHPEHVRREAATGPIVGDEWLYLDAPAGLVIRLSQTS